LLPQTRDDEDEKANGGKRDDQQCGQCGEWTRQTTPFHVIDNRVEQICQREGCQHRHEDQSPDNIDKVE
jgi:hypothetical protein